MIIRPAGNIEIGAYILTATGIELKTQPELAEHVEVGRFIAGTTRASSWWLADWLRYGESRKDWSDRIATVVHATGLSDKTLKNYRAIGAIPMTERRTDLSFSMHVEVAALDADERAEWLERAARVRWTSRELRAQIKKAREATVRPNHAEPNYLALPSTKTMIARLRAAAVFLEKWGDGCDDEKTRRPWREHAKSCRHAATYMETRPDVEAPAPRLEDAHELSTSRA
jgi:hypothetical protein